MKDIESLTMHAAPWAIPLLTMGIFIFDLVTPVGIAASILYVIPLLLTLSTSRIRDPIYFCGIATGLLWAGLFLKPPSSPVLYGAVNRILGASVLWIIAGGLVRLKLIRQQRAETEQELTSERVERAHAEGLMMEAQTARYYADREAVHAEVGRERAEQQLQISQLRLEGIIKSAMDAIITVDDEQKIILFNRAAEQMFGSPTREVIGQPLDRFLPTRFREGHRRHVQAFGQAGVTSRKMGELGTVMGLRSSGEEFPIEAAISHITVEKRTFYTVILRDITERQQAEELVARSIERLTLATRAAEIGVWDWDIPKNTLVWDDRMFALYGLEKEDFGGVYDAWLSRVHPDDRGRSDEAIQQALRHEKPYDLEFRIQWPDGGIRILKADGLMVWDSGGHPLRMTGTNYDITDLKQAEEQFRLVVESSPNGLLVVDKQGTILLVNRQVEQQFGYERAELIGQSVDRLVPQQMRSSHAGDRAEFFAHSESRAMGKGRDLYGVRKDGQEFPLEIGLNPIQTWEGMRVLASVVDISERKRLQEQLRKTERVAEFGTLASGMAHEIGTPMNVILGRAEYLMDRAKDEPVKKGLQTIIAQVERITKVMNQLLAFARRRSPERVPVMLKDIVEDSLDLFRERLGKSRVTIELDLDGDCPRVQADANQMSQVMINLIMNALHAMEDGGRLRIGMAPEQDMVKLTVADTGHGIPQDVVKKVFEPFFTTKEFGKGTGLGLTVVKGIIEEHQGSIAVESDGGKGTTFTILLPASSSS